MRVDCLLQSFKHATSFSFLGWTQTSFVVCVCHSVHEMCQCAFVLLVIERELSPLRHIVRYTKQCFFNPDTWGDFEEETSRQRFEAQAQACALESLQNVHDPMGGEQLLRECSVGLF